MKLVTVIFAAFAYICSSSLFVGAQLCTQNELQSKYNQTSLYDFYDEFRGKSTRMNLFDCTTDNKTGTINYEFKGNKFTVSIDGTSSSACENKEAFKDLTVAEFLENKNYSDELVCFALNNYLLMCGCPKQAQCDILDPYIFCDDLNTNDTSEEDENLSVGAIVGIAVGSFVFLVGVILLVYRYRKGKWPWQSSEEAEVGPMMVVKKLIF